MQKFFLEDTKDAENISKGSRRSVCQQSQRFESIIGSSLHFSFAKKEYANVFAKVRLFLSKGVKVIDVN